METMEIIKEAMKYPSNDLAKLAVYIALAIVAALLASFGFVFLSIGLASNSLWIFMGIILMAAGLVVGFIIMGYQVSVIRSGIEHDEKAPEFNWKANLITGIKYLVLTIVYFIIPAIIVLIVAWATNLFGMAYAMMANIMAASMAAPANTTILIGDVVPQSLLVGFGTALMINGLIALILFLIFAFLQTMGQSRLAKTDDLRQSLNIPEAFRDIGRIGYGKVFAVVILIFVIIMVINLILIGLSNAVNGIAILSIVVTPYLMFFASRATGLLYSDIA